MFKSQKKIWRISSLQTAARSEILITHEFDVAELPVAKFYQYSENIYEFIEYKEHLWPLWDGAFRWMTDGLFTELLVGTLEAEGHITSKSHDPKNKKKEDSSSSINSKVQKKEMKPENKKDGNNGKTSIRPIVGSCSACKELFHVYEMRVNSGLYYCSSCYRDFEAEKEPKALKQITVKSKENRKIEPSLPRQPKRTEKKDDKSPKSPKGIIKQDNSFKKANLISAKEGSKNDKNLGLSDLEYIENVELSKVVSETPDLDNSASGASYLIIEHEEDKSAFGSKAILALIIGSVLLYFLVSDKRDEIEIDKYAEYSLEYEKALNDWANRIESDDARTINSAKSALIDSIKLDSIIEPQQVVEVNFEKQVTFMNDFFGWVYRSGEFYFYLYNLTDKNISIIDFAHSFDECEESESVERVFRLKFPTPLEKDSISTYRAAYPLFALFADRKNCLNLVAAYREN